MDPATAASYQASYQTMVGRADLDFAFYEAALTQLRPNGVCAFICADRWMLNQYGAELRRLITSADAVDTVIELHQAHAWSDSREVKRAASCGAQIIAGFAPRRTSWGPDPRPTASLNARLHVDPSPVLVSVAGRSQILPRWLLARAVMMTA